MTGIKNLLIQNECFNEEETKILSVLSVCKLNAKKSRATSVLAFVSQNETSFLQIVEFKIEKEFKKKRVWQLDEFKMIDVKFNEHEFEFVVNDDSFHFASILLNEKQIFLTSIYKAVQKSPLIMNKKAIFKNIPDSWKVDDNLVLTNETRKQEDDVISNIEFDDFKELGELETMLQTDSQRWLGKENNSSVIRNADRFIEYLSKNLVELDGANVESILASKAEEKVITLMQIIDTAIDEVECVEKILDEYEEIMSNIRDSMEKMGEKNSMIEIANKNNLKLLQELEKVISQLDLSHVHQLALTDTDLTSLKGLQSAKDSGRALQNAISADIDPTLLRLAAVQDQRKRFDKWKAKFTSTISRHLNNLFIHLGNDLGEHQSSGNDFKLSKHNHHRELNGYQELMHLMKTMDMISYDALAKVYTNSLSKVYERDLRQFFDQAKWMVTKNHVHDELNQSTSSKSKVQTVKVPVYGILGISKEQWSSAVVDATERQRFDTIFEKVLTEIDPIALDEQIFCINFFQLDVLSPTSSMKNAPFSTTPTGKDTPSSKRLDRQINEEVRRMMSELFGILESELLGFIMNFEKLDPL